MSGKNKFSSSSTNLYRRAEELLSKQPQDFAATLNVQELIHDLHVHQMELTLQNEELIQTQQELLESRNLYCDLYDFAPVGYVTIDEESTITNANLMAATLFKSERDSLIGRKITSYIWEEDQDIYYFYNQSLQVSRNRRHCEIRLLKSNGDAFYARLDSVSYLSKNNDKLLYRVAIIDITEKKRLEDALRHALVDAEKATKAKSEFLANMSHEIRTPLNAIIGITNILKMRECSLEKQELYIQTMDESANTLLQLINDTLDFAKIESRMLHLEITPFNLYEAIQESVHIMGIKAEEKKLQLSIDYPGSMHKTFWGDALRIRQILLNLLNNAIKFTETGSVTIKVEIDRLGMLHIKIIDTGIGIAPDKLEYIFKKFTQEDASMTRKYGGTGLGLSICRQLAQLMQGDIEVTSQIGKGSTFIIHLPLEPAPTLMIKKTALTQMHPSADERSNAKILLVEDYSANILVATHLLEHFGYAYEVAKNSYEALNKLKKNDFSLILMDIQMEGRDGLQTTRLIREIEKNFGKPRIPIIAMTAHALHGDKEKCMEAGMDGYLTKPVDAETLQNTLMHFVDRMEIREPG